MLKYALALVLSFFAIQLAQATEVTIMWTLPTTDCQDDPIDPADLGIFELYIGDASIPGAAPPECSAPPTVPPAGFTPVIVQPGLTSVIVDLPPGQTYFFRSRVQGPGGLWSNLSMEISHVVDFIQVRPPAVLIIG